MVAAVPRMVVAVALFSMFGPLDARRQTTASDDLLFLQPWFEPDRRVRQTLAERGVVARALDASRQQISVIAVCPIDVAPGDLISSVDALGSVRRDVLTVGRFHEPPAIGDLAQLSLD